MRLFAFALLFSWSLANAQTPAEPAAAPTLDTVLVTGEQPGPGLWKVSKGDHVLWILGTLSTLPKDMTWRSKEVEDIVAESQEVLDDADASVDIGLFRAMTLLPSILRARKNAQGATLMDILPPDLYARWSTLKRRYIGRDAGVEKLRPMLAARELYEKAIAKSGLTTDKDAWKVIRKAAKQAHVPITELHVKIPVDDPKAAIQDFQSTKRDLDVECLRVTIERIETDMEAMRKRANAWATGDLETLRKLPYPDQHSACLAAVSSVPRLREQLESARAQIDRAWVEAAMHALEHNASTFAVLPLPQVLAPEGRLAKLRDAGYEIEAPE